MEERVGVTSWSWRMVGFYFLVVSWNDLEVNYSSKLGFTFWRRLRRSSKIGFTFSRRLHHSSKIGFTFRRRLQSSSKIGFNFSRRLRRPSNVGFTLLWGLRPARLEDYELAAACKRAFEALEDFRGVLRRKPIEWRIPHDMERRGMFVHCANE